MRLSEFLTAEAIPFTAQCKDHERVRGGSESETERERAIALAKERERERESERVSECAVGGLLPPHTPSKAK